MYPLWYNIAMLVITAVLSIFVLWGFLVHGTSFSLRVWADIVVMILTLISAFLAWLVGNTSDLMLYLVITVVVGFYVLFSQKIIVSQESENDTVRKK